MGLLKYLSVSQLPFLKDCISIVKISVIAYRKYLKKVHITEKFQKTEFNKYPTRVGVFNITSIYFIQFTMDQYCHNSCSIQTARMKIGY